MASLRNKSSWRDAIDFCLGCTLPAMACDDDNRCPYRREFGTYAPRALKQDSVGRRERREEYAAERMSAAANKVLDAMGLKRGVSSISIEDMT